MKKKILALCLVVVLAITAVTGATLAYFTDTDEAVNTFTTANVKIDLIEKQRDYDKGQHVADSALEDFDTQTAKVLYPITGSVQNGPKDKWGQSKVGNYLDKIVTIKNLATDAYVRLYYAIPAALTDADPSKAIIHVNFGNRFDKNGTSAYNTVGDNTTWNPDYKNYVGTETKLATPYTDKNGIVYNVYYFDYNKVMTKDETTAAFMAGIYMDEKVGYDADKGVYTLNGNDFTAYNLTNGVKIPVFAVGVQAAGFTSCKEAVDAAFGANYNPFNAAK